MREALWNYLEREQSTNERLEYNSKENKDG